MELSDGGTGRGAPPAVPDAARKGHPRRLHPPQHPSPQGRRAAGRSLPADRGERRRRGASGQLQPPGVPCGLPRLAAAARRDPAPHLRRTVRPHRPRRGPAETGDSGRCLRDAGLRGVPSRLGTETGLACVSPAASCRKIPARTPAVALHAQRLVPPGSETPRRENVVPCGTRGRKPVPHAHHLGRRTDSRRRPAGLLHGRRRGFHPAHRHPQLGQRAPGFRFRTRGRRPGFGKYRRNAGRDRESGFRPRGSRFGGPRAGRSGPARRCRTRRREPRIRPRTPPPAADRRGIRTNLPTIA